jgi:hypothetical protein
MLFLISRLPSPAYLIKEVDGAHEASCRMEKCLDIQNRVT